MTPKHVVLVRAVNRGEPIACGGFHPTAWALILRESEVRFVGHGAHAGFSNQMRLAAGLHRPGEPSGFLLEGACGFHRVSELASSWETRAHHARQGILHLRLRERQDNFR